jgi:hypothetical protein
LAPSVSQDRQIGWKIQNDVVFGVKLLKCPFGKKKSIQKIPPKNDIVLKKKKKKERKRRKEKKKKKNEGYVISPRSPASSRRQLSLATRVPRTRLAEPNSSPSLFALSLLLSFFLPRPLSNSRPLSVVLSIWL